MTDLVIYGNGDFAELAHYYFSNDSHYRVRGFCVDAAYLDADRFDGLPLVAVDEAAKAFPSSSHHMFVALGIRGVNAARAAKVAEARALGYELASFLSSKAGVPPDLVVPANSMVMEYVGIHPRVGLGENTIVWSGSRLGFKSRVGDNCWIVSALLGEQVVVGDNTFIGLNATIAPKVRLGQRNIVGAGAVVTQDSADDAVYRGPVSAPSRVPSHRIKLD